jgi:FkbM family methyltransferase
VTVDPDVVLRFLAREPAWFVDVGVGCGEEAETFKAALPKLKCLGLEPNGEMFRASARTFPGELLNHGAWSSAKDMLLSDKGKQSDVFGGVGTSVVLRPLDELLKVRNVTDAVLWLDVEGAELEALRGAKESLKSRILAINAETRVQRKYARSCCMSEVDSFLAAYGFAKVAVYNVHGGDDPHEDAVYVKI